MFTMFHFVSKKPMRHSLNVTCGIKMHLYGAHIFINTDSLATLRSLESHCQGSLLTWECRNTIKQLARGDKVTLLWVPGHCGVEGNEKADGIAKSASRLTPAGPEPFCGLGKDEYKAAVQQWELENRITLWRNTPGLTQSKKFVIPLTYTSKLLKLSRAELLVMVGLLTCHSRYIHLLYFMGKSADEICRLCGTDAETAEHVACKCPELAGLRTSHMGKPVLDIHKLTAKAPRDVVGLINTMDNLLEFQ